MIQLLFVLVLAFHDSHDHQSGDRPVTLMAGLGSTHHAIATRSEDAQK